MHRRTATKVVVTDSQVLNEIDAIRHVLDMARRIEKFNTLGLEDESPRLERQLVELAQKATEEATTFVARALTGEEYDDLVRRHPPTSAQFEQYRERLKAVPQLGFVIEPPDLNPDSMAFDLLAACLVEPDWSRKALEEFWRELSKGEQTGLWNWLHELNNKGADLPFFNAVTATTNGGGGLSTMPANGASRTVDS